MRSQKLDTNKDVAGWGLVVSGVGWKEGEVAGRRVQWCVSEELPGELFKFLQICKNRTKILREKKHVGTRNSEYHTFPKRKQKK